LNGEKNPEEIIENQLLDNFDKELLNEVVKRSK